MKYAGAGWVVACLLTAAGAAMGADGSMTAYYGNTLECTSEALTCHIWLKPDGTYRQFNASLGPNDSIKLVGLDGHYEMLRRNGRQETCLVIRGIGGPMGGMPTECYALSGHKVGDAWDDKQVSGATVHFRLLAGHRVNGGIDFFE